MIKSCKSFIMKLFSITLISIIAFNITSCIFVPHYTEDIADYNKGEYFYSLFLEEIPQNAEVIKYAQARLDYDVSDNYLELRFSTVGELEQHIENLKEKARSTVTNDKIYTNDEALFVEVVNPYDSSYREIFVMDNSATANRTAFVGYSYHSKSERVSFYFEMFSYSIKDLVVIQTWVDGTYPDICSPDYIPQYFRRFNIPIDEKNCNRIYIDEAGTKYMEKYWEEKEKQE